MCASSDRVGTFLFYGHQTGDREKKRQTLQSFPASYDADLFEQSDQLFRPYLIAKPTLGDAINLGVHMLLVCNCYVGPVPVSRRVHAMVVDTSNPKRSSGNLCLSNLMDHEQR
ncbi:hypothetical protein T265_04287 [Opisthorchis viverrini]|uniref:Uncharacterized protein n=1 Tax=Opisthorchis viverrini TaxID=6198 RepID=A0A074ZT30_OPIVI|nr:hypothetical protein T265_04287 [Opisthorchis viverrini]KER28992.1 hypothetical protein T265_04287 [Opisthorchis viverrini]